ncbi:(Zrou_YGOB_Anc_4.253a) [Zygosaccharomyces parabailii]|nr:(Zrou_YGOB_Anc_4.253a) [Zygosaccharomyces parabailii]
MLRIIRSVHQNAYRNVHQASKSEPISPHKLLYVKWGWPVGRLLLLSVGSYYSLYYLWMYLEDGEIEDEKKKKNVGKV